MTTTPATSPRTYAIGDTIPGHGKVSAVSATAYLVGSIDRGGRWVPFYGPRGVDAPAPVVGLVSFADGSTFGGAR